MERGRCALAAITHFRLIGCKDVCGIRQKKRDNPKAFSHKLRTLASARSGSNETVGEPEGMLLPDIDAEHPD
jgi:hypothetical protein